MLWRASEMSIRRSVANALEVAGDHRFNSIAFPVIGSGSGGFTEESALAVMLAKIESSEYGGSVLIVRFRQRGFSRSP
jgi:O-acetyl-ADP-ribose deacetylase (regulator of RNase III)